VHQNNFPFELKKKGAPYFRPRGCRRKRVEMRVEEAPAFARDRMGETGSISKRERKTRKGEPGRFTFLSVIWFRKKKIATVCSEEMTPGFLDRHGLMIAKSDSHVNPRYPRTSRFRMPNIHVWPRNYRAQES